MAKIVLIVEDEESIRELLKEVLEAEGFTVLEAADGESAIDIVVNHQPPQVEIGMIISDIMLPKKTGIDLINHLRAIGNELPIIAMSASRDHLAEAIKVGAHAAIAKPFALEELFSVVSHYCA
jgi:DNA-binding response OmpR family regulator